MTAKDLEVSYQDQVREDFINAITIEATSGVSYISAFSEPGMPVRELGVRYLALDSTDPDLKRIRSMIRTQGMADKSVHVEPQVAGRSYRRFLIHEGSRYVKNVVDRDDELPPPLEALERELTGLVANRKLASVLAFTIQWDIDPVKLVPGAAYKVHLRFVNTGRNRVRIGNPAAFQEKSGNTFSLNVYRSGGPSPEDQEFAFAMNLVGTEMLTGSRQALRSDQELLSIEPGAVVDATIAGRFPKCEPGRYSAELVYLFDARGKKEEGLVGGEFHAEPIPFTMSGPTP